MSNDGEIPGGAPYVDKRPLSLAAEPSMQARLVKVKAARNPLLEAAQPLLRALADMPDGLAPDEVEIFHRLLTREVSSFQSLCNNAQVRHEHAVGASYALCTAIDEAAHSTRWGGGAAGGAGVWAGHQLAVAFHDDARGGDKVFLLIGRLVSGPDEHIDLIELLYFVLGLGFEGRYATAVSGRRQIETIRHRLFSLLNASRAEVANALSPEWQGVAAGRFRRLRVVPPWLTAIIATLALIALLGFYKFRLLRIQSDVVQRIALVGKMQPPAPAISATRALRLKELLSVEIARGTVSVQEDALQSAVTFRGDEMFVAGQSRLDARILPVLAKVASEIGQVAGSVRVVGHTDDRPIRTRAVPDNQALSERRAAAVAAVLEAEGVEHGRLKVEGHADAEPVADNATPSGRARNRRVDIVVSRGTDSRPSALPTH
ncbi:type VI secretion system protein TssL, long form [Variovorax sp. RHLX14]|uniref:type VI secretion system protein TssL, long form n=1 Tax=Variovorax sp. RHLX14 TaxID=1259731 RepID=UPI003F478016